MKGRVSCSRKLAAWAGFHVRTWSKAAFHWRPTSAQSMRFAASLPRLARYFSSAPTTCCVHQLGTDSLGAGAIVTSPAALLVAVSAPCNVTVNAAGQATSDDGPVAALKDWSGGLLSRGGGPAVILNSPLRLRRG